MISANCSRDRGDETPPRGIGLTGSFFEGERSQHRWVLERFRFYSVLASAACDGHPEQALKPRNEFRRCRPVAFVRNQPLTTAYQYISGARALQRATPSCFHASHKEDASFEWGNNLSAKGAQGGIAATIMLPRANRTAADYMEQRRP